MSVRNAVLGLGVVLGFTGSIGAMPPVNPLVEGREPNPVVREFYEPEPATFEYVGESPSDLVAAGWWVTRASWDSLLNKLTMPLGAVELWD